MATITSIFLAELEAAVARDRRRGAMMTRERFRGLPTDTVAALARNTNDEPALTPNEDGEFLLAA